MKIRDCDERDLERYVEVTNRSYPDYAWTVETARHEDSTWSDPRFFKARYVREDDAGRLVGFLDLHHQRGAFDPRRYRADLNVDPDARGRGHGSALLEHACRTARERGGEVLIGGTKESMTSSLAFLVKRGCVERQRAWESRLEVNAFDFSRFAGAEERVFGEGIRVTTLADEIARDREAALRKAFALQDACRRDVPSVDPHTPGGFETFLSYLEAPTALREAYFLAAKDDEYLGLSNLWQDLANDEVLYQGLTGVHADWRGRGIAMALKLQTVRYARTHGKREIRTWNNTVNRPMLRINEAMGFVKQPVWIEFEKRL